MYPIRDDSDVAFLCSEIQLRLDVVTKAVEQKKSEEQKLRASDVGNNWYGNDLVACVALREHLIVMQTFSVLLNGTSYTCENFGMRMIF